MIFVHLCWTQHNFHLTCLGWYGTRRCKRKVETNQKKKVIASCADSLVIDQQWLDSNTINYTRNSSVKSFIRIISFAASSFCYCCCCCSYSFVLHLFQTFFSIRLHLFSPCDSITLAIPFRLACNSSALSRSVHSWQRLLFKLHIEL